MDRYPWSVEGGAEDEWATKGRRTRSCELLWRASTERCCSDRGSGHDALGSPVVACMATKTQECNKVRVNIMSAVPSHSLSTAMTGIQPMLPPQLQCMKRGSTSSRPLCKTT